MIARNLNGCSKNIALTRFIAPVSVLSSTVKVTYCENEKSLSIKPLGLDDRAPKNKRALSNTGVYTVYPYSNEQERLINISLYAPVGDYELDDEESTEDEYIFYLITN